MSVVLIRTYGDPILRERCEVVAYEDGKKTALLLEDIVRAIGAAGMSAPQIGLRQRVICFQNGDVIISLINPKLSAVASEEAEVDEGCWSLLGTLAPVSRPVSCEVVGTNIEGQEVSISLQGMPARSCQHEIDHLNGVLFIDLLSEVKRHLVLKKHRKFKIDKKIRANGIRIQLRP